MTIAEYATGAGISRQAAQKTFKKYKDAGDLIEGTHYTMNGRSAILLPLGIEEMNKRRKRAAIVIVPKPEAFIAQSEELRQIKNKLAGSEAENQDMKKEISRLSLELASKCAEIEAIKDKLINALEINQELSKRLLPQKENRETHKGKRALFGGIFTRKKGK